MTKRYSRTVVDWSTARKASYDAKLIGSDHADYAGNCTAPVMIPITGMKDVTVHKLAHWAGSNQDYAMIHDTAYWLGDYAPQQAVRHVDLAVRCRKCEACRKARQFHWRMRAEAECQAASRTWFGTLTLTPEHQFRLVLQATSALRRGGTDYSSLSDEDQFKERIKPLIREVQKYFKRLRKAGCKFRYLVAIERHKSGAPHVHLLVHETAEPVRHKQLRDHWSLGFVKFNLVAENERTQAARYVSKYLTKALSRMLASSRYGRDTPESNATQSHFPGGGRTGAF